MSGGYPLRDRPLTGAELEKMRLGLSTFRDGSGQFVKSIGEYMPNFLDFERVTALVCGGITAEDKGLFDVEVPTEGGMPFGVSCKMSTAQKHGCSFMELSNSHAKFQDEFNRLGVDWREEPEYAGPAVVELVTRWHQDVSDAIDLEGSRYLILSHDSKWQEFQLHCFSMDLCRADLYADIEWSNPVGRSKKGATRVVGHIDDNGRVHRLWELYQGSGGQLKYYPLLEWADWVSSTFALEMPPIKGIPEKVAEYFPGMWPD